MRNAQTEHIDIVVNGQPRTVPEGMNLAELMAFLGIDPSRVALEMNKVLVRRPLWSNTPVTAGVALEVVHFVGGG